MKLISIPVPCYVVEPSYRCFGIPKYLSLGSKKILGTLRKVIFLINSVRKTGSFLWRIDVTFVANFSANARDFSNELEFLKCKRANLRRTSQSHFACACEISLLTATVTISITSELVFEISS